MESLQITLPDAPFWIRTTCICGEQMRATKLRRIKFQEKYMVRSEYVCPACQIWMKMVIPCTIIQQYTSDPELIAPAPV